MSKIVGRNNPYGKSGRTILYKLIDNFSLFWLKYVEHNQSDTNFMTENMASNIMKSWRGIAFEELCWQHVGQIKQALGIAGVGSTISAWGIKGTDETEGAQIDLIIARNDNVVNLCEMKFVGGSYIIDKEEEVKLRNRIEALKSSLSSKQTVHLTMVTTYGISYGKHSGVVQKQITLDDLFQ